MLNPKAIKYAVSLTRPSLCAFALYAGHSVICPLPLCLMLPQVLNAITGEKEE